MTAKLPELPEPFSYPKGQVGFCACGGIPGGECLKCPPLAFYMDEQMSAYGKACRDAALEEAARTCDNAATFGLNARDCADAIRAALEGMKK